MPGNHGDKEGIIPLRGGIPLCQLRCAGNILVRQLERLAPGAVDVGGYGVVACGQTACKAYSIFEPAGDSPYVQEVAFTGPCLQEPASGTEV